MSQEMDVVTQGTAVPDNRDDGRPVDRLSCVRVSSGSRRNVESEVIRESPLTLYVNETEVVTLLTVPMDVSALAVGFLYSEGWVTGRSDIVSINEETDRGVVRIRLRQMPEAASRFWEKRVIGSGCGKATTFTTVLDAMQCKPVSSNFHVSISDVVLWMKETLQQAPLYRATRGAHSVALCTEKGRLLLAQDIGRHNALDRIMGACLLEDIPTENTVVLTTGRLSSDMVVKAARAGIPVLASRSSTTTLAVALANRLNMTILGCMRSGGMDVYTHPDRITA